MDVTVFGQQSGDNHMMYHGDSCEVIKGLPDDSVGLSVFSPPFSSLYTYSNSDRDIGNCKGDDEFFEHFGFIVAELLRITKPGRMCSVHCMNLPRMKSRHGFLGIYDFRGDVIRCFQQRGWVYHSEVCIWKDPVIDMQRTKSIGLLHKQVKKDSCVSRNGIPDYVCTFRKPGDNDEPVSGEFDRWVGDDSFRVTGRMSIDVWQRYASPVWMDINQTRTLQYMSARDSKDERHICPLQLDVIERCIELWSNPGDVVFSPFGGIGSEPYTAVISGRRGVAIELKESYFRLACDNLRKAEKLLIQSRRQGSLFSDDGELIGSVVGSEPPAVGRECEHDADD